MQNNLLLVISNRMLHNFYTAILAAMRTFITITGCSKNIPLNICTNGCKWSIHGPLVHVGVTHWYLWEMNVVIIIIIIIVSY